MFSKCLPCLGLLILQNIFSQNNWNFRTFIYMYMFNWFVFRMMGHGLLHVLLVFNVFDHAVEKSVREVYIFFKTINIQSIILKQAFCWMCHCRNVFTYFCYFAIKLFSLQYFNVFVFILYTCSLTEGNFRQLLICLKSDKTLLLLDMMLFEMNYSIKCLFDVLGSFEIPKINIAGVIYFTCIWMPLIFLRLEASSIYFWCI